MDDSGVLMVHSFNADQSGNLTCMQIIEKNFTSVHPEYHRLDKVKAFYRKSFNVDCYINPDKKSVIVFVDNLDIKKMLYNYITDKNNGVAWERNDVQVMYGLHSYYRMVEKETIDAIVAYINKKMNVDVIRMMKDDLR